ncbi:MobP3 family relaxase [Flavonifractor sp. An82]|uniref:MobP3 family relaxase n=1 Tax=Flavonifractor sp. An82 TaxID=1965660 RepID=UPI001FA88FEA|nr:MobP3 family relaxase [Flavonifractor sp. An82]
MAGLIVKSPYLKCGGGSSVSGYLRYIGTRERVEILTDDRPPTRKQEQLITKLTKDFPEARELGEYSDYKDKPTKANASVFITRALEENWSQVQQSDGYMKYIATRPRAERLGDHGLFGDEEAVNLEQAMRELDQYNGNVWTHILSLKREDAARLGYDNAKAWRNLLRANRNEVATAMNIQPNHFRWYAAFHDEGKHPHVHMMAWSTQPGEAYLTRDGIRNIKSALTNQIFKQEMLHTYEQKSQSRDELVREARRAIRQLTQEMTRSICTTPEIEQKMEQLAGQLETVKGKKSYGYLPKSVKKTVDEVVDKLEELPVVRECYDRWCWLQDEVESYYHNNPRERKKLSQEKEFRQIKNAVIQEAERIRLGEISFEDDGISQTDEPEHARNESQACRELWRIIGNEDISLDYRDRAVEKLEQVAERGDAHAQYRMGQLYRDGPLLIPDNHKAKRWLTQAAKQGLPEAQYGHKRIRI